MSDAPISDVPASASDRYIVVSADGHAGLACDDYRPYLESKFYPAFEEYVAERNAHREQSLKMNFEYIMGWETDNEEGLKGAFDPAVRDKELDSDGVAADVLFADADAVTGAASPPFGAGLFAGAIVDPDQAFAGAHAHNRFLAESARYRHTAAAVSPWCRSPTTFPGPWPRSNGWRPSPASAGS